jgi:hypothetical protein
MTNTFSDEFSATTMWHSVQTPSTFREIELPEDADAWNSKQRSQYARLEAIAERHGTSVRPSMYRVG